MSNPQVTPVPSLPLHYSQSKQAHQQKLLSNSYRAIDNSSFVPPSIPSHPSSIDHDSVSQFSNVSPSSRYTTSLQSPTSAYTSSGPSFPSYEFYGSSLVEEPMQVSTQKAVVDNDSGPYGITQYDSTTMPDSMWNPMYYSGMNAIQRGNSTLSLGLDFNNQPVANQCSAFGTTLSNIRPDVVDMPLRRPDAAVKPTSINPDWLKVDLDEGSAEEEMKADASPDCPTSLLRSISPSSNPSPGRISLPTKRRASDTPFSAVGGPSKHKRKAHWSASPLDEEADEPLVEIDEFEDSATPSTRRDRRRLQNRLAQRAFRARSKVHHQEAAKQMIHLERLTEVQATRIDKLSSLVDRLQRENTGLRSGQWPQTQGGKNRGSHGGT